MTASARIKKLYPALTAHERALVVLNAWKQGEDEDTRVRTTMPDSQVRQYNRLIGLMNGCNHHLGPYIIVFKALCEQTSIKFGWLCTVQLWTADSLRVAMSAFQAAREPISESEHAERLAGARAEEVPLNELAELLAERDSTSGDWKRVVAGKARMIEEAIDTGAVAAHSRARRALVNAGSFYDWLGEPTPVYPEWGIEYDVRPDGEDISRAKERYLELKDAISQSPAGIELPSIGGKLGGMARFGDEIARTLRESIQQRISAHSAELAAIDGVVAEVEEEFDGEDPLLPALRSVLEDARVTLTDLSDGMRRMGYEVEVPEQDPDVVGRVRALVHRETEERSLSFRL